MSSISQNTNISPANLIYQKRIRLHMTQKELADAVGLPKFGDRTIRRWESGETKPSPLELKQVLQFPEQIPFPDNPCAPYAMIDLFAGIGGTRMGFWQTHKTHVVFSSEIDKFAVKTYRANYGDEPCGDITRISEDDIPAHDILVGGFPCQAFSQAGKKLGFDDTRGTLFFEIARIIKSKRPKAFLLENVKNLLLHDGGNTFRVITDTLKDLDYETTPLVYKAKDFGVPQNRERVYIVGFDRRTVKNYRDFIPPVPPCPPTKVGTVLENDADGKYTISDALWHGHQRRKSEHIEKGNGFGYSLFNADSPYTNTISARYYKDGSEILIEQDGQNPRRLTPREAARLQGFPEEFIIPVSDTQAYKQFGNSVAVPVIHAIAQSMIEVLDKSGLWQNFKLSV